MGEFLFCLRRCRASSVQTFCSTVGLFLVSFLDLDLDLDLDFDLDLDLDLDLTLELDLDLDLDLDLCLSSSFCLCNNVIPNPVTRGGFLLLPLPRYWYCNTGIRVCGCLHAREIGFKQILEFADFQILDLFSFPSWHTDTKRMNLGQHPYSYRCIIM